MMKHVYLRYSAIAQHTYVEQVQGLKYSPAGSGSGYRDLSHQDQVEGVIQR